MLTEAEKSKVEGLHLVRAFLLVGTLEHPEVGRASHGEGAECICVLAQALFLFL